MTPAQWNEYERQAQVIERHQKWKEQQKQLITEIMNEDAKDGLYDTVNKMAEEMYGKGKVRDYEEGFIDGYKKAQETLYTEEQLKNIDKKL
jgi:hypothetical protein